MVTRHFLPRAVTKQLIVVMSVAACGSDAGTGPELHNGSIQVRAVTHGTPIDPSGYTVALDGGTPVQLSLNGTVGFAAPPGERRLEFAGWRFNCNPVGHATRMVSVSAGELTETTLEVECGQAPPAGRGRELVFATRRDGVGELYRVNDDGSGLIRLMTDQTDHEPAWSPDGSQIAFRLNVPFGNRPSNGEVVVAKADGSDLTNLTTDPDAFDVSPAWSPASTQIVYARTSVTQQGPDELYVIATDGTGKSRVTRGWQPDWSKDGSTIVFVDSLGERASDLYLVTPHGTGRVALTSTPGISEVEPVWSPDDSRIAYASDATGRFEVYVMKADATGVQQLTHGTDGARRDPAWSPDGNRIAFVTEEGGARDVYVMNADGTDVKRLTYGGGWEPSWRP